MVLYKRVVEVHIVGNKYLVLQQLIYLASYFVKRRRIGHHAVVDTCKPLYEVRDGYMRIYKALVKIEDFLPIMYHNSDLRYAICRGITSSRLNIHYSIQHPTYILILKGS